MPGENQLGAGNTYSVGSTEAGNVCTMAEDTLPLYGHQERNLTELPTLGEEQGEAVPADPGGARQRRVRRRQRVTVSGDGGDSGESIFLVAVDRRASAGECDGAPHGTAISFSEADGGDGLSDEPPLVLAQQQATPTRPSRTKHRRAVKKYKRRLTEELKQKQADDWNSTLFIMRSAWESCSAFCSSAQPLSEGAERDESQEGGAAAPGHGVGDALSPTHRAVKDPAKRVRSPAPCSDDAGLAAPIPMTCPINRVACKGNFEFEFFFRSEEAAGDGGKPFPNDAAGGDHKLDSYASAVVTPSFFSDIGAALLGGARSPKSTFPIAATMSQDSADSGSLLNIQVKHMEGVSPLPVRVPLAPGTDLSLPPSNYLLPDVEHNIHVHAPGFQRDEETLSRSLISSALRHDWQAVDGSLVLLSSDALRSVFEAAFDEKPVALTVQRVGHVVMFSQQQMAQSTVGMLRERALLGKALYRMKQDTVVDGGPQPCYETDEAQEGGDGVSGPSLAGNPDKEAALTGGSGVATVDRVGSGGSCDLPAGVWEGGVVPCWKAPHCGDEDQSDGHSSTVRACSEDASSVLGSARGADWGTPSPAMRDEERGPDAAALNFMLCCQRVGCDGLAGGMGAMSRIGSAISLIRNPALSRYSQILHWKMGMLGVLVGLDTPIVHDHCSNTEQMVKLVDVSQSPPSPVELQREALRTWFEGTLANVPHVGVYTHHAGIVQHYEVRKVQELLGYLERRMATEAMTFTNNVLQWIVTQTVKDGYTYAVLRNYASDQLEMYECPSGTPFHSEFSESTAAVTLTAASASGGGVGGHPPSAADGGERTATAAVEGAALCQAERQRERQRLNWELAMMCFRIGIHRLRETADATSVVPLLIRSFTIFVQQSHHPEALRNIRTIAHTLPLLAKRLLTEESVQGAKCSVNLPDIFRDALLSCGQFEARLYQALDEGTVHAPLARAAFLQSIVFTSAAICVVVARTIAKVNDVRDSYRTHRERSANTQRDTCLELHGRVTRDLLQVAVEGMVRLELSRDAFCAVLEWRREGSFCEEVNEDSAVTDPCLQIPRVETVETAVSELYGDLILLAMSDPSPFTANILAEVSRRIMARDTSSGSISTLRWLSTIATDPVTLSFTALRVYAKAASTRRLLVKSAHVYYYVGVHYSVTQRHTKAMESLNLSKNYFLAAEKAKDDWIFCECAAATHVTIADVNRALGDVCMRMARANCVFSRAGPSIGGRVGGDRRTPHRGTVEAAHGSGGGDDDAGGIFPLALGGCSPLDAEEDRFWSMAVDFFSQAGDADYQLASALLSYANRQLDDVGGSGRRADAAFTRNVAGMLLRAQELCEVLTPLCEWEVLRMLTSASWDETVGLAVRDIHERWSREANVCVGGAQQRVVRRGRVGAAVCPRIRAPATLPVSPVEVGLQLALVCCVQLEAEGLTENPPDPVELVRRGVTLVLDSIDALYVIHDTRRPSDATAGGGTSPSSHAGGLASVLPICRSPPRLAPLHPQRYQALLEQRVRRAGHSHITEWAYETALGITLRMLTAAAPCLPPELAMPVSTVHRKLLSLQPGQRVPPEVPGSTHLRSLYCPCTYCNCCADAEPFTPPVEAASGDPATVCPTTIVSELDNKLACVYCCLLTLGLDAPREAAEV